MSFTVTVADMSRSVPAEDGETVLSALLAHGVGFAYSCQSGNCGTCKCELVSGEILEMEYSEHALSTEERSRNIVLACRSQVWSDVVVRRLEAEDFIVHPSRVMRCRVCAIERVTHDVLRLQLEIVAGGPYDFSAGQFARLEFAFAPDSGRDYSMANTPDDPTLQFHIRVMREGSVSRRVADALRCGDFVKVSGPSGTAYLRAQHDGPMVCIAGGTGIAPIRSIAKAALEGGFCKPVYVYFGVRQECDVYLEDELADMQSRFSNLFVNIVLSESQAATGSSRLPRRSGLVTDTVAADLETMQNFKLYVAGPPAMVDAATALARSRGVKQKDLHADAFYPAVAEASLAP